MDPVLQKVAERLREVRGTLAQLDEQRAELLKEISRLESVAAVVRELDPYTVLDERSPSAYASLGLTTMTLARACEAVLRVKGRASSRDLLDILVAEGKLKHGRNSSLISVIGALKNHPELFVKQDNMWTLNPAQPSKNGDGKASHS